MRIALIMIVGLLVAGCGAGTDKNLPTPAAPSASTAPAPSVTATVNADIGRIEQSVITYMQSARAGYVAATKTYTADAETQFKLATTAWEQLQKLNPPKDKALADAALQARFAYRKLHDKAGMRQAQKVYEAAK